VERARGVKGDFALTEENALTVTDLNRAGLRQI
jgi:hypothetical protein